MAVLETCFVCGKKHKIGELVNHIIVNRGPVCIKHPGVAEEFKYLVKQNASVIFKHGNMDQKRALLANINKSRGLV